jgi:hypothetical protein
MSHLSDLAAEVTAAEDQYARGDVDAGHKARALASTLAREATRLATRLADELERGEIRALYDNDPHRGDR